MPDHLKHGFRLDQAVIKPAEGVIAVDGRDHRIEPKAMEVLLTLVAAAKNTISREDLITAVWPRGFVTGDVLSRCISHLRSALNDDPRNPRYIATVPRKGYRLLPAATPLSEQGRGDRILVLPFQNLSPDAEEYLADGLTELLIARLSVALDQAVISRTTAMTFKDTQRDLPSIGAQLGVRWVVEGSVIRLGEQVQVVVQVIDGKTDTHVWAETWTRPLTDALTLLNEISREIVTQVRAELEPESAPLKREKPLPAKLLRLYLLGLQQISLRSHDALRKGIEFFGRVLKEMPDHAPSLSGLACCWVMLSHYGAVPVSEGFPRARQFAQSAIRVATEPHADAFIHLGAVEFFFEWNFAKAESMIEHGLETDPDHDIGLLLAANLSLVQHRYERAQGFLDRALSRDPLNVGLLMNSGDHLILQRRFGEAISALESALEIDPRFRPAILRLALALAFDGRGQASQGCLQRAREAGTEDAAFYEYQAIVNGRLGRSETARAAANSLQSLSDQSGHANGWSLARAWTSAGDLERGAACIEAAFQARSSSIPFLNITPVLEPLRDMPRIRELTRQLFGQ